MKMGNTLAVIATTLHSIIELRRRGCGDVTVDNDVAG